MGFQAIQPVPAALFDPPRRLGMLKMWVPGRPQTAGSKTAIVGKNGRAVVVEAGTNEVRARKRTWRGDLRDAAEHARAGAWALEQPTDAPLWVHFVFVRSRPGSHMRSGRHEGTLKDSAAFLRPTSRPDAVKLARAAEDALTGVLWLDDSQIVHEVIEKAFGDNVGLDPRAEGMLLLVQQAGSYRGPSV